MLIQTVKFERLFPEMTSASHSAWKERQAQTCASSPAGLVEQTKSNLNISLSLDVYKMEFQSLHGGCIVSSIWSFLLDKRGLKVYIKITSQLRQGENKLKGRLLSSVQISSIISNQGVLYAKDHARLSVKKSGGVPDSCRDERTDI